MTKSTTPFSTIYDSFLSKTTEDMYMELTELETYQLLEELLISAVQKFEFPRVDLTDYEVITATQEIIYNGAESNHKDSLAIVYSGGCFNNLLTHEEVNILATYMIVEWLGQQLASVENTRMKYSSADFKFTSQANHMAKLQNMKTSYEKEGFHLQRLYKRRSKNKDGIYESTMWSIMYSEREA